MAETRSSARRAEAKSPSGAERSCVGCGERGDASDMVRLVLVETEEVASVVPDAKGGSFGRGAHVHPVRKCIDLACQRGLPRSFKRSIRITSQQLVMDIAVAFSRRLDGLLSGGVRGGHVAVGTDAVTEAWQSGRAHAVILAANATAAAQRSSVQRATAEGKTLVFGDKLRLARAIGRKAGDERDGVAVCAITDAALALAVRRAWLCAVSLASGGGAVQVEDTTNGETRAAEDE